MLTIMDRLISLTVKIFVFLFPVFFLTITSESYEYNKLALLILFTTFFILLFSLKIIKERKITFIGGTFTASFFFLTCIVVISTLFQTPNIAVALTTPLSTTSIISGFVLYIILINGYSWGGATKPPLGWINISAILLCLYVIGMYTGILPQNNFTPAGSLLATTTFLSIIAVYLLAKLVIGLLKTGGKRERLNNQAAEDTNFEDRTKSHDDRLFLGADTTWQEKGNLKRLFVSEKFGIEAATRNNLLLFFLPLLLIGSTTIFLTIQLTANQKPLILPFSFGWHIFTEVLKDPKSLFLGIGPANFLTAFTFAKPLSINNTPFFNIIFTSSSSFFLNLITETGVIAGVIFFIIIIKVIKIIKSGYLPFILPLLFSLILQVFLPSNMSVFILTIILLALVSEKKHLFSLDLAFLGKLVYLILLPGIIITILTTYFGGRAYLSDVYFKKSLDAILVNDGTAAYNFQREAINLNPYLDRYRIAFSKLSLSLANALAAKQVMAEEDKQNIPRLLQQAIDQARTAVTLYPTNSLAWDNLAQTYAALSGFVQNAYDWAIKSYQQKMLLDPLAPGNHLALGGIYNTMQKIEEAEKEFRQAITLKPDFAAAHYNLAVSLRQQKKFTEAYKELQSSMALVSPNSTDSAKIKEELDLLPFPAPITP